jgi:glycosyltransferase involved in cell wall biosynthesis
MPKEKILIIDNVFAPSFKDRIVNGVQKFSKAQRDVLSDDYEVHYITAKGSDLQFPNQYILQNIQSVTADKKAKIKITKFLKIEISNIIDRIEPDYVLDNSCKHMTTLYPNYKVGVIFEHYHKSSKPISVASKAPFDDNGIYWCGVSRWQNKQFRNLFDGITSVHLVETAAAVAHDNYGIFIGRWDRGKTPHIIMKIFSEKIKDCKLHIFTTLNYGYATDADKKIIDELSANPNIIFHIDAPRSDTMEYLKHATFVLGGGKESTGIVSMEGASYGVPYIVRGSGEVAEQEHMHPDAMTLLDLKNKNVDDQLILAIEKYKSLTLEDRLKIAKDVYVRYNRDMFKARQIDLLQRAKKKKYGV